MDPDRASRSALRADPTIDAGAESISYDLGVSWRGIGCHHPLDQPVCDEGRRILVVHQVMQKRLRLVHHVPLEGRAEGHEMGWIAQRVATHLHSCLLVRKEGCGAIDRDLEDTPRVQLAGCVCVHVHLHRRRRGSARRRDAQFVDLSTKVAWPWCANSQCRLHLRRTGQHRCIREHSGRGDGNFAVAPTVSLLTATRIAHRATILRSRPQSIKPAHREVVDNATPLGARNPVRFLDPDPAIRRTHYGAHVADDSIESPAQPQECGFRLGSVVHTSDCPSRSIRVTETSHRVVKRELDADWLDVLVPDAHVARRAADHQLHHVRVAPDEAFVAVTLQIVGQHDFVRSLARIIDAHALAVERRDARLPTEGTRKT
eukprot:5947803-Prymnesium_polylepis.1